MGDDHTDTAGTDDTAGASGVTAETVRAYAAAYDTDLADAEAAALAEQFTQQDAVLAALDSSAATSTSESTAESAGESTATSTSESTAGSAGESTGESVAAEATASPTDRDYWEPDPEADELGAWLTRCDVARSDASGPLDGFEVGVKDNVAVAGVPTTCGSPLLTDPPYVPQHDATVVERLLSAGARIVGKTNMDEFAFGGSAETMRLRLARNPVDPERQPGSSSAGSGIVAATREVDLAVGSDTGGSVRFPAAWCGVPGLKPTRGLVSHEGFVQFAKILDNVGLLAPTVEKLALGLDAVAGPDPRDERTLALDAERTLAFDAERTPVFGAERTNATDAGGEKDTLDGEDERSVRDSYAAAVADVSGEDAAELTVGVPRELFAATRWADDAREGKDSRSEDDPEETTTVDAERAAVDETVADALDRLEAAGATLEPVSIDHYDDWLPAWLGIGMTEVGNYLRANAQNYWSLSPGRAELVERLHAARQSDEERLGTPLLAALLYAHHRAETDGGRLYPLAHRARRRLAAGVDDALSGVDVLAAPTVPVLPPKWGEGIDDVFGALANTGPFNVSGHPAVSVPAGTVDGLPVGLQFVGRRGGDATALRAAAVWTALAE